MSGRLFPVLILILLLMPLAPAAAAAAGAGVFETGAPVALAGDLGLASADGPLLLYGPGPVAPFALSLEAERIEIDRRFANATNVCPPAFVGCTRAVGEETRATIRHDASFLAVARTRPGFAVFVAPVVGAPYAIDVDTTGRASVTGARFEEVGTPGYDVETSDDVFWGLRARLDRPHANFTAPRGTVAVEGDFTLFLWNVDYLVTGEGEAASYETGLIEKRGGIARDERLEEHRVTVRGGSLRATLVEGRVSAFPREADLVVAGLVTLPDAEGRFETAEGFVEARGEALTGRGAFSLKAALAAERSDALLAPTVPRLAVRLEGDAASWSLPLVVVPAPLPMPDLATGAAAGGTLLLVAGTVAVLAHRGRLRILPRARATPEEALDELLAALGEARWSAAKRWADRVLEADPENVDVHLDRALALEKLGRAEAARSACEAALRLAPERGDVHIHYAHVLARLGLASAARVHLDEALALDPRLAEQAAGDPDLAPLMDDARFPR
ncbi:MAG TPA: hypothetical protein VM889_03385 [Candidatus Thermoplasmatota archaeon]|nr:hypothetical protein [Candidatus Thermoplasmatota archaeon]